MKFKHLLISGVLTILVAFGLLTVLLPQAAVAAPPEAVYSCFICPGEPGFSLTPYTIEPLTRGAAQDECRAKAVFCVDLTRTSPGNPIACINCR